MQNTRSTEPICAGVFHVGNTCPCCQGAIEAGQMIVVCPDCGSLHHDTCWSRKQGCSSYHCDQAVHVDPEKLRAEITISPDEVERVQPPPPCQQRPGRALIESMPPAPQRLSRLALASAGLAACGGVGVAGALMGSAQLLILGMALALAAIVTAVCALIRIVNAANRRWGLRVAGGALVAAAVLLLVFFASLDRSLRQKTLQREADLKLAGNLPTEEHLARIPAYRANALRANVVVSQNDLLESNYGSGVILRIFERKAWILTNKHVLGERPGGGIRVLFYTGEESQATVAWSAPGTVDLAVLSCTVLTMGKYQPISLATALASSGDKVFAVGNPMGLAWTYTEGTISSLRTSMRDSTPLNLYQTQTPINVGNSGGGLYTADGLLLGINTWTEDKSVTEGLNFAIAVASLLELLPPQERERIFGQRP